MSDERTVLDQVLDAARGPVEMTSRYIRQRAGDWPSHEWECRIHCLGRTHVASYYRGLAASPDDPPSLADVIECLLNDAASVRGTPFKSWADELGYNRDSRKAFALFRACRATRRGLQELFGTDTFDRIEGTL